MAATNNQGQQLTFNLRHHKLTASHGLVEFCAWQVEAEGNHAGDKVDVGDSQFGGLCGAHCSAQQNLDRHIKCQVE